MKKKKKDGINPVKDYQNKEELQREQISNGVNKSRRNLLKFLLIGSGALLLGRIFGPGLLKFFFPPKMEQDFNEFRVTKDRKELIIYDKKGEEILIIDDKK